MGEETPTFRYSATEDTNDGKEWSEMDLFDLTTSLAHGGTISEAAAFLCRSGTVDEVRRKAEELGLAERR